MNRCAKCIFPETIPGISFDERGVCNFCQEYKNIQYLGEKRLFEVIGKIKGNKEYDCLVPCSGGRDSTFILYYAKNILKIDKIIAVNYNNEYRTDQALINMKNACKILNIDFVSFKSDKGIASKIVKKRIKSTLKIPFKNSIRILSGSVCSACTYGYKAVVYRVANQYKIPLIIWGNSKIERTTHITSNHIERNKFDRLTKKLFLFNSEYYRFKQRLEFPFTDNYFQNIFSNCPRITNQDTKEISLFDYIPWNRNTIKRTIQTELNWKKPEDAVSTWRIDCRLDILINYIFFRIFGCSKSCFGFHNMINENQMTRDEAIDLEEKIKITSESQIGKLLSDIGLSEKEIIKLINN